MDDLNVDYGTPEFGSGGGIGNNTLGYKNANADSMYGAYPNSYGSQKALISQSFRPPQRPDVNGVEDDNVPPRRPRRRPAEGAIEMFDYDTPVATISEPVSQPNSYIILLALILLYVSANIFSRGFVSLVKTRFYNDMEMSYTQYGIWGMIMILFFVLMAKVFDLNLSGLHNL